MSCLGPEDLRMVPVNAYDAGRPSEGPRDAGTLPASLRTTRDALLMAPDLVDGRETEFLGAYKDWRRDVRAPALAARTEASPSDSNKATRLTHVLVNVPEPSKYEDSAIGNSELRKDLVAWFAGALVLMQEIGR